ncbi:alpha/beta hydrolase [Algoriphagus halophytocola]|uniref:Alpha/beta hydrolase n=1 Tax=Algoriphagus halophytocola TaxID=2991499 RepID=A0ABY6MPH7_9BACT|nr:MULTISPECIES: alpha/beta hydrolase [unclassified Algoriphagus]UZD24159.1 alpha/beta hydrolase [Algoriphagus sp. TR-M5]WBL41530.1 alpha/beta hydrolase [Algoriphagus sp. TR-M9]
MMKFYPLSLMLLLCLCSTVFAQQSGEKIYLWENGAPGFEERKDEPELAQDWWVRNIHNPSITLFKPENPNGAFILICPGGGFRNLGYNGEGVAPAKFLNELGLTVGVLKYRLFREENSPYDASHPTQDVIRAMRMVRANAEAWKVDPDRVGIMGFSAGGEVVNWVAYDANPGKPDASDPVDRFAAQPNFQIQVYPGPLGTPESVAKDAPPAFLVAANKDECCSDTVVETMLAYRKAGADVELHLYSKDEHAFNMGFRSEFVSIQHWPDRLKDWLEDHSYFGQ